MRIAFRTDASVEIGTGHVMRCLTLADALREQGARCVFICRPHTGHLLDLIAQRGHEILALPALSSTPHTPSADEPEHARWLGTHWRADASDTGQALGPLKPDWLVIDHYALDHRWENVLRPASRRLMVVDDLADRVHDCDLLLDQNLGRSVADYVDLVPSNAVVLTGPKFALLRPEFAQLRDQSLARRIQPQLKRLLIAMGGVDQDNVTTQVLDELAGCQLPEDLQITVVLGPQAPWQKMVQAKTLQMPRPTQLRIGVTDMASLMMESDLAIGAAGGTAWERCCLGLPSLLLVLAHNQYAGAMALQRAGAAVTLENAGQIRQFLKNHLLPVQMAGILGKMSQAAALITDGQGVSALVSELMKSHGSDL